MKSTKGYSLVITFTVAIETKTSNSAQLTALSFPPRTAHLHATSSKDGLQILPLAACSGGTVFPTGTRLQPQDMTCCNSQLETDDKKWR